MKLLTTPFIFGLLLLLSGVAHAQDGGIVGQIAYIDQAYNVWRYDAQLEEHTRLTSDSAADRRYLWPTWAVDGRLAWFSHTLETGELVTDAWVQPAPGAEARLRYRGREAFNYAYWSPGNCAIAPDCRHLAILLSSPAQGMFVELLRDGASQTREGVTLRGGPPFYFSWSHDGSRMLWQRNNRRYDIYDADEDRLHATLAQTPGLIQAPHWSPTDARLLLGVREAGGSTALAIVEGESQLELVTGIAGAVAFNWSPDGRHVAWREQTDDGFGALRIADTATGTMLPGSPRDGVISFVWSPDGRRIAWLELVLPSGNISADARNHVLAQTQPVSPGLRWTVMELESGTTQDSPTFIPTQEMLYYLQYFDQFAQSHRLWSPDSRFLLYAELRESGPGILVLDTDRMRDEPRTLAQGWIGVWSFGAP